MIKVIVGELWSGKTRVLKDMGRYFHSSELVGSLENLTDEQVEEVAHTLYCAIPNLSSEEIDFERGFPLRVLGVGQLIWREEGPLSIDDLDEGLPPYVARLLVSQTILWSGDKEVSLSVSNLASVDALNLSKVQLLKCEINSEGNTILHRVKGVLPGLTLSRMWEMNLI